MENKTTGYKMKQYPFPTKRYCQTLDLKDDPTLINEYIKRHSQAEHWQIISEGIKEVGILEMEIYLLGKRLFMIVETPEDFDWDTAFAKLATLPQQREWEEYMSIFQDVEAGATSSEKWKLMDRIFKIYE
ncbi:L-rhamnose mutarotase [Dysgonomonas sp. Marseille-P4677]|uniref:L-rhamnose mutarotase n=1 Tax=Dysgonomonas sp. Marseille-P4677 TaxID=2364790 RepID=UPI0019117957|nr:L-rhamnose mutarotase [Dysgonomonas sp. Marseille-P4677]MBK5722355.1 L-rhamnose mutarotase [Dysgonomonas sp. Marseille-P4677]